MPSANLARPAISMKLLHPPLITRKSTLLLLPQPLVLFLPRLRLRPSAQLPLPLSPQEPQ